MTATRVKAPASRKFDPTDPTGFVVRSTVIYDGSDHESVSYWYGPDNGWGTTWGGLDGSVAVWPTKALAELAFRDGPSGRRYKVVPVEVAICDEIASYERHAARKIAWLRGES